MLKIRPAAREDTATILDLIRELAEYERLAHEVTATDQMLAECLFGARPTAESVVAEWEGQIVGFALFFTNFSTFLAKPGLYLEDLYVKPSARGQGIGKALLIHLAGLAIERDYGRFEWAVLDWNEPALEFYAAHGAVMMHDWRLHRVSGQALHKLAEEQSVATVN
ncbi:MAG: GNAT family N-acetyltransferase [Armatimonadetes bacterium]|nr:GNAT family N-acetyltransferase [Armatimonadota bacterium]